MQYDALRRMASERHSMFTESLRRSVAVTAALDAELEAGNEIQVVSPDGTVKKLLLV